MITLIKIKRAKIKGLLKAAADGTAELKCQKNFLILSDIIALFCSVVIISLLFHAGARYAFHH